MSNLISDDHFLPKDLTLFTNKDQLVMITFSLRTLLCLQIKTISDDHFLPKDLTLFTNKDH